MFREIDLSAFPLERQEKLEKIYRYEYFDVLLYRSNLWRHSHRVLWMLEEFAPIAEKYLKFDIEKARAYALVHDDAEMVTGDIQAIVKARMTPKETKNMEADEMKAINELVKRYPEKINGYSYKDLLENAVKKDCVEAQLVSYLDKLDAFCESLHEVYAGNLSLLRSIIFYASTLPLFPTKYPALQPLLSSKEHPFVYIGDQISPFKIEAKNYIPKPHTEESIKTNTDFPFYKKWKEIIIARGKTDWLIKQKESLTNL